MAVLVAGGLTAGWAYLVNRACSGDDHAVVVAAPDIAPILSQLNTQWAKTKPAVKGRCVSVSVYSQESNVVAEELGHPWQTQTSGPAPDVWVPESSVWAQRASVEPLAQDMMPELQPSLARSPSVIAMPRSLAVALGWPTTKFDWPDIVTDSSKPNFWASKISGGGKFKFTMTNPISSTSGLLTLMSVVDSSDDGFVNTTAGAGDEQPNIISLADAVRSQSELGDTSDIMAALSKADTTSAASAISYVSAFPALEQDVIKYNERDPKEQLVAVYPTSGSYDADNPYLILNKTAWGKPPNLVAAQAFETFVRAPAARSAFLNAGFRDANRQGDATFDPKSTGVLRSLPGDFLPRAVLDPVSVQDTINTFTAATRPTNVLIAMDVSTSMNNVVPATGGKTRLDLARAAALSALQQFDPQSSVGLWEFSSNLDGTRPYQTLVPLGGLGDTMSDGKTRQTDLKNAITSLRAKVGNQGNTGLYDTIDAAQGSVSTAFSKSATNFVVVITDGEDDPESTPGTPQVDLSQLQVDLTKNRNGNSPVPVVTIGLSNQADTKDLATISRASGGVAYTSPTGFDMQQVLEAALFGQVNQG
ncbi:MAG TPA: substrate-binding and VWA domain-containing protein [Micromonosporaceae bacterium]